METSSVRIDAPAKADIGAVVPGKDLLGVVFVHLQFKPRRLPEKLAMLGQIRIRRIPDTLWLHERLISLDVCLL